MEITGKIIEIFPAQTGKSAKGEWKKQDFILETQTQFSKKIFISNWNDKIDLNADLKDKTVKVLFDIESREFNGKWYTDVKSWKLEVAGQVSMQDNQEKTSTETMSDAPWDSDPNDGLPF